MKNLDKIVLNIYLEGMKKNLSIALILSVLTALNVACLGVGSAQAATCAAKDKYIFSHNANDGANKPNFQGTYALAGFVGSDEYIQQMFDLLTSWKKSTKSAKLKAALIKFETQFETYGASGTKYAYIPQLKKEYDAITTIFKFNRC